jgi:hypothetical protein
MTEAVDPKKPTYDPATKGSIITYRWGVVGVVSALGSVAVCFLGNQGLLPGGRLTVAVVAVLWAVGAPTWFWYEYFYLYRKYANEGTWDLFKHGQQLGVAIWAGVATSLGVFAASTFSEPPKAQLECKVKAIKPPEPAASGSPASPATRAVTLQIECEQ